MCSSALDFPWNRGRSWLKSSKGLFLGSTPREGGAVPKEGAVMTTEAAPGVRFLGVDMPQGIRRRHFSAYLFVTLIAASYAGLLTR